VTRAPIDEPRLRAALAGTWQRVVVVAVTGSTNADLLADESAPDRSLLVAEYQRAGRGRLDRRWSFPERAGLAFSVLLRPTVPIPVWGWLPLLTGVALYEAVAEIARVPVVLKWPNDLLAGPHQGKLAGILAHTSGPALVVGIGLNVSLTAGELPVPTATSLQLCDAATLDRTELLIGILARLDSWLLRWERSGGDAAACGLAAAYRAACATVGQRVTVTGTSGVALTGTATGLDPDGRLRVFVDGREQLIGAGDVEHLRPA
jgi:BirA family biotin operon repressor/biotin-[acetyl-CoA-carboxylase] ligase